MSINLELPYSKEVFKPKISIFGIGGAGGNALNNMIRENLQGVEFIAANTDAQALESSLAVHRIQLGTKLTQGLGAGSSGDVGGKAAEESREEILRYLDGNNMVFLTAGMGGGTGTGATPFIAKMARERDILTVAVVTKPFNFEGKYRMNTAEAGIEELKKHVDTLIVIPNQNLFRVANEKTTFTAAFEIADKVLHSGVRSVTDLITMPGLINLDFSDIRTIMTEMGRAMMGVGESEGEDRAIIAAEEAISNPLLDDISISGARGMLVNVTGGSDMTLFEVDSAVKRIVQEADSNANIIFGSTFNENMKGRIRISIVATGIGSNINSGTNSSSIANYGTNKGYNDISNTSSNAKSSGFGVGKTSGYDQARSSGYNNNSNASIQQNSTIRNSSNQDRGEYGLENTSTFGNFNETGNYTNELPAKNTSKISENYGIDDFKNGGFETESVKKSEFFTKNEPNFQSKFDDFGENFEGENDILIIGEDDIKNNAFEPRKSNLSKNPTIKKMDLDKISDFDNDSKDGRKSRFSSDLLNIPAFLRRKRNINDENND